jgi:hypothetical protein
MGSGQSHPLQLEIERQVYTQDQSGDFTCAPDRRSPPTARISVRGTICCFGQVCRVRKLSYPCALTSLFVPSSIDEIRWESDAVATAPRLDAIAFEWRSRLRRISPDSFRDTVLRSLCVPASVDRFVYGYGYGVFPPSLRVLTFEAGSGLRRIEDRLCFPGEDFYVWLPASLEFIDGRSIVPGTNSQNYLSNSVTWALDPGNPNFKVVDGILMSSSKRSVIRYCGGDDGTRLDSLIEELGTRSFYSLLISAFAFPEPSRLRLIGEQAFACCWRLGVIAIPSTVEVIGRGAFQNCMMLQEVRIASGSRLRLIEKDAFDDCRHLNPVDVPSSARIRGRFKRLAKAYDEEGASRVRVRFIVRPQPSDSDSESERPCFALAC